MVIVIKGTEIKLNDEEFRSAKRVISQFLDSVRNVSDKEVTPTYWFTLLMMMHIMSQEMINDYDVETMALIMDKLCRKEDKEDGQDNRYVF